MIEMEKLKTQKEIAMINNEAKLLLQNEDQKIDLLFRGMDVAEKQQDALNAPAMTPPGASAPAPSQPPQG